MAVQQEVTVEARFEALRGELATQRSLGEHFISAWERGQAAFIEGLSGFERRDWAEILVDTRRGWERAYNGEPQTPAEKCLETLR